jgi:hypothetical protein
MALDLHPPTLAIHSERAMGWRQHIYQALILGVFVAFLFTVR